MSRSVLFVSDIAATQEFAAGTVIKSIIRELPSNWTIDQAIIGNPFLEYPLNSLDVGKVFFTQKPNAQWQGAKNKFLTALAQIYVYSFEVKIIKAWLQNIVNQGNYQKIVVAFQCQVLTDVISSIDFKGATTVAIMWDHPSWFAREHLLSERTKRIFFRQWFDLMIGSNVAVLPSKRAIKLLGQDYRGQAHVLYPFITARSHEKYELNSGDSIRIGFAGSPYANQELKYLIEFLEQKNWTVGAHKVELHMFTKGSFNSDSAGVVNRGWLSPSEVTDELAKCTLGFLPYPFKSEMSEVVDTSFASKFSIYMAASLPTLYLGPKFTALGDFIEETRTGLHTDETTLEDALQVLITERAAYSKRAENTFDTFFSQQAFSQSVADVFDLEKIDVEQIVDQKRSQDPEPSANKQRGLSPRVKRMSWGILRSQEVSGPVEYYSWVSLSKYMYVAMRPGAAVAELKKYLAKKGTVSFGSIATRTALFIFSVLANLFKSIMMARMSRKSKTKKESQG